MNPVSHHAHETAVKLRATIVRHGDVAEETLIVPPSREPGWW